MSKHVNIDGKVFSKEDIFRLVQPVHRLSDLALKNGDIVKISYQKDSSAFGTYYVVHFFLDVDGVRDHTKIYRILINKDNPFLRFDEAKISTLPLCEVLDLKLYNVEVQRNGSLLCDHRG